MHVYKKIGLLLLALAFVLSSTASAADKSDKSDRAKGSRSQSTAGKAGSGECTSEGTASAELDVNNVRARLFTNGNLFYNGDFVYEIPKGSGKMSNYASSIWVGGYAGSELRMAAAQYENYEFRPGPLFEDGTAPTSCEQYDRFWKVSKADVQNYEASGEATTDLREWPTGLGAPTLDANGDRVVPTSRDQKINLAAGERPEILGDQSVWWIMNDVAAPHNETQTPPIGLEIQAMAFAFNQAGALGNTTFYKYKITYRGDVPLTDTYMGLWADVDLGDGGDDYVGSDTTLGLGYAYNGDNDDGGSTGYGANPPALGYDFFQGPLVPAPGQTHTDPDGTVYQDARRLGMQKFIYYNNVNNDPQGNPNTAEDYYGYLTGFWPDGVAVTEGGTGRGFSNTPADYMYPAMPPAFWSEENIDGNGTFIKAGDRRLIQSAGPFTMNPGDVQEIVFGIVWSQAEEGADNPRLASLEKLKRDDALAQQVFDLNFQLPNPPDAPRVTATPLDQAAILTWDYAATSNNYLGSYEADNPLLSDVDDVTYRFEGFLVYEFTSASDNEGRVVAVYDKANGITRILKQVGDLVSVDVDGKDNGLQYTISFDGLTNYREYYYGVQAYAYNVNSSPQTYRGPIARVTVVPSRVTARAGGTALVADSLGADILAGLEGRGDGVVAVKVVDPAAVTGHKYQVKFYTYEHEVDGHVEAFTTYDIVDETTGEVKLDGRQYADRFGKPVPQVADVAVVDGLSFTVVGPEPDFANFQVVANADGPLSPPALGAADFGGFPVPEEANEHQQVGAGFWFLHTWPNGTRGSYDAFVERTTPYSGGLGTPNMGMGAIVPDAYEVRFTGQGQAWANPAWGGSGHVVDVPFEWWNVGVDPADPSDDYQLVPYLYEFVPNDQWDILQDSDDPEAAAGWADHEVSSAANDPWTEPVYVMAPVDKTPGSQGYEKALAALGANPDLETSGCADWYYAPGDATNPDCDLYSLFARTVFVNWNGGDVAAGSYNQDAPETGTVFRIITTKPNLPGDTFTLDTAPYAPSRGVQELAVASLKDIGIVPNPYKGASAYEVSRIVDVARFTNLPERCTIRVFTTHGTLVRTLTKNSPETFMSWDLQTEEGLPIASGMYLIHVEVPGVGETTFKFGVIKKRVQLNEL